MPHLRIETNIPSSKILKDITVKLCSTIASTLGKPLHLCVATVIGDVNMSWGGTNEPAAQATLTSIGSMGVVENKKHSKNISEVVEKELGIPKDRMYIVFNNAQTAGVGYKGTTFHDIYGR